MLVLAVGLVSAVVLHVVAGSADDYPYLPRQNHLGPRAAWHAHGGTPGLSGLELASYGGSRDNFQNAAETYVTVILASWPQSLDANELSQLIIDTSWSASFMEVILKPITVRATKRVMRWADSHVEWIPNWLVLPL